MLIVACTYTTFQSSKLDLTRYSRIELLPDNVPPPHPFDAIAFDIENRYERIMNVVRERKRTLLTQLSEFREEYDTLLSNRDKTEQELKYTKEPIETIKENDLKTMQQEFLSKIEDKIRKLRISTANYFIQFECESRELENKLSTLGELIKLDYKLPNYSEMVTPVVAVGKKAKDEFDNPRGIAFDEGTQLIYVCDMGDPRIKIVSMTGEFISEFGGNELVKPWGILLHKDSIYVTDIDHAILQFQIDTHQFIRKVGKRGSGGGEFRTPRSLAIGLDGDLYVAEENNNIISVLDVSLNFKRFIQHKTILSPLAVQFTESNMLILSFDSLHRVHLLSRQGKYLKSIISIESSSWTWFFCLDRANNILVSITFKNLVQVYNEEGELLHTIGNGQLDWPYGLTATRSGRLIVVSKQDHGLQIF